MGTSIKKFLIYGNIVAREICLDTTKISVNILKNGRVRHKYMRAIYFSKNNDEIWILESNLTIVGTKCVY